MKYILLIPVLMFLFSCDKESKQAEKDDQIIRDYLSEHNIDAIKHSSGLYYSITDEGSGVHPNLDSEVEVRYKGYFTNGKVFNQTQGTSTATFEISGLIEGWQIGIPLLKEGGEGTFFIPSALGYGSQGYGSVPGNTVLIFDIELVNIQ